MVLNVRRERVRPLPRAGAALPEARAPDVGPGARAQGQVGDTSEPDTAHQETGPGQLRRGVLWQVVQQHRGGWLIPLCSSVDFNRLQEKMSENRPAYMSSVYGYMIYIVTA